MLHSDVESHAESKVRKVDSQGSATSRTDVVLVRKVDSQGSAASGKDQEPPGLSLALLCIANMLEGVDSQLFPVSMYALQQDFNFHLTDLAYFTVAQGVCMNLATPLWGILADRGVLRRKSILVIGLLGQGIISVALASTTAMWSMLVLRAMVGATLAAIRPIAYGILADVTAERKRGKIFGWVQCSLLTGMFLSIVIVGNMSRRSISGIHGWRIAFAVNGLLAIAVAGLQARLLEEKFTEKESTKSAQQARVASEALATEPATQRKCDWIWVIWEEVRDLARFLTIPSFSIMVIQGIFGTIPWTVFGNMMLFFQLSGIEDTKATILTAEKPIAGALGNLLGGYVADFLAARCGRHGRPLNAQITVAIGIPLVWLLFGGISPGSASFGVYFILIASFGLMGSWAQCGTNFPILADIVPQASRSRVLAWECALENSIAHLLGPPLVSFLATEGYGYTFGNQDSSGTDLLAADALGKAMQATICIPWCVTLLAYTLLHWSYPQDAKRMLAKQQQVSCPPSQH